MANKKAPNIKFIGPYSSDMLHDMVSETRRFSNVSCLDNENKKSNKWSNLENVQFYAYGASAPDDQLLGDLSDHCRTVQRYLESLGIHLQRTIATDDKLADAIAKEPKLRFPPNEGANCNTAGLVRVLSAALARLDKT